MRPTLLFVTLLALSPCVVSQHWLPDTHVAGVGNRVFGATVYRGDLVVVGQSFLQNGQTIEHVARFDGNTWRPFGNGIDSPGLVRAATTYLGDLVVAGAFTSASGTHAASIARWDGSAWQPLGQGLETTAGPSATVYALAVFQGELYAGGDFTLAGGQSIPYLARWDGSRWASVGGAVQGPSGTAVYSLLATPTHLYVGGLFDHVGASPANNVAAWDGSAWSTLGAGVTGNPVQALASFQGDVYVGGAFGAAGGVTASRIARWDGSQWHDVGGGIPSTIVDCMQVYQGALYVGGRFFQAGQAAVDHVARWDGTQWQSIGGVAGSGVRTTVLAMTEWDNDLVLGGEFQYGGASFTAGQAVVSTTVIGYDGSSWRQLGRGAGVDRDVLKIVPYRQGHVAVGLFTYAGRALTSSVAYFDGVDWTPLGTFDDNVADVAVSGNDLYVSGTFTQVDGQSIQSVAHYDGSTWQPMGNPAAGGPIAVYQSEVYRGAPGALEKWDGVQWGPVGAPLYGSIDQLAEFQGVLYIGGTINQFGSGPGPNLVSWDGQSMATVGGGTDGPVDGLDVAQGALMVGGRFSHVGGVPADRVAVWATNAWVPLPGIPTPGSTVYTFADLGGELYVGGTFTGFGGGFPAQGIARLQNGSWVPVADGVGGAVHTLCPDERHGQMLVGGSFQRAGTGDGFTTVLPGIPASRFAILETRPSWTDLGHALPGRGTPHLEVVGDLSGTTTVHFDLRDAPLRTPGILVLGLSQANQPLLGGTLVPAIQSFANLITDSYGSFRFDLPLAPGALPTGTPLVAQIWAADLQAQNLLTASNGVQQIAP